jgi:tetratricopeptide (TPR) repeat protein
MMRGQRAIVVLAPMVLVACASNPDRDTLAKLHHVKPDVADVKVEDGLDQAMASYRRFLEETPQSGMTPEAMRRLADLKVEKEYGIEGDGALIDLPATGAVPEAIGTAGRRNDAVATAAAREPSAAESDADFERRTTQAQDIEAPRVDMDAALTGRTAELESAGPLEAIELYKRLLAEYPTYEHNDQVLYQMARAYDELGQTEEAMQIMQRMITTYPDSRYVDEVYFRRAEYFFARHKYHEAEGAYAAIIGMGVGSSYYELALYKLGWALYKMEFYEEALHRYMALLDYKVSIGYDFDQPHEEADERRIADTFRVISLSFSNLGGPEVVDEYFDSYGHRGYEDRVYGNLGEFYLAKLRYNDAAATYNAFVARNPFHKVAPRFSMRVIDIYTDGGFPKLVVESKKDFAKNYGLKSPYWQHFDVNEAGEVLAYLKSNLKDLANHYHALYQDESLADEQAANYGEAIQWYREYLDSFPQDADSPPINYQLADLLLEHKDYGAAAREYEHTAYDYAPHEQAAAAGYAAVYAHREDLKIAAGAQRSVVRQDTVTSSLRFADTFPEHEHAAEILGAAADDLYDMKDFPLAIESAHKLIDRYPAAELPLRRSAWVVVAHSSFDLAKYEDAEQAYTRVLELTAPDDESREALVDNLAASIYKQGEQANLLEDYRAAADNFLRVKQVAPTSKIAASAEYDAGAALMHLEDWGEAAKVFDDFRTAHPDNELGQEATKQIAYAYREGGQLSQSAAEYERVGAESEDPELRREALLLAGDLYEQASQADRALAVYERYVEQFPQPLDVAVETRYKMAQMYRKQPDDARYREELARIVDIDAAAGADRTDRTRFLAAQSALVLAQTLYEQFAQVQLTQPFEQSLKEKQKRMDTALEAFGKLVDYEVGEVTAAATYYMAEVYSGFSRSLMDSQRPAGLSSAELADYDSGLEEEAYPFEEQAIDVHEKNLELMTSGVYNPWIEKSLGKLAELMPGRYAKSEISSGFLDSVDTYAYHVPNAPVAGSEAPSPEAVAPPTG